MFRTLDQADVRASACSCASISTCRSRTARSTDATRIERIAPTILEIADKRRQGDPALAFRTSERARSASIRSSRSLRRLPMCLAVRFPSPRIASAGKRAAAVNVMQPGDILCLENTRFHAGEESNDPDFVGQLAALGDIFVNDAFSVSHRAHASVEGTRPQAARPMPAATMQEELDALSEGAGNADASAGRDRRRRQGLDQARPARQPASPRSTRSSSAAAWPTRFWPRSESRRQVPVRARARRRPRARSWPRPKAEGREIVLPVDAVVAQELAANAPSRVVAVDARGGGRDDPRHRPRSIEHVCSVLARVKTLVWNGPFGAFETRAVRQRHGRGRRSRGGTHEPPESLSRWPAAATRSRRCMRAGVAERFTYVSTAGGAFLEWLEGKAVARGRDSVNGRDDHPLRAEMVFGNKVRRKRRRRLR